MKATTLLIVSVTTLAACLPTAQAAKNPDAKGKKAGAHAMQAQPLAAQLVKVGEDNSITVRTQPITTPDGILPATEKTYATTDKTVVMVNTDVKKLADLIPGEPLRLVLSDDAKTVQMIHAKLVTPADKAARKAAKTEKNKPTDAADKPVAP